MSNAKYIGRVGGLAMALGVGIAVATTPGVAWADGTGSATSGGTTGTAGAGTDGTSGATGKATEGDFPTEGASAAGSDSLDSRKLRRVLPGMVLATGHKHSSSASSNKARADGDIDDTAPVEAAPDATGADPDVPAARKAPVAADPRDGSDQTRQRVNTPTGAPRVSADMQSAVVGAAPVRPENDCPAPS